MLRPQALQRFAGERAADENAGHGADSCGWRRGTHHGMTWIWIVITLVVIALFAVTIFAILSKTTAASRGGVEHPPDDKRRGDPPFESIERHS